MATLGDPYPFIPKPSLNRLGSVLESVGTPDRPLVEFNSTEGTFTCLQVVTINGQPYPPPASGDLVDTTTAIIDAVDPTIRITFDAAGTPGTTGRMTFNQAASRVYTFQDPGANTDVFLSEGSQTVAGTKTFADTSIRVVDPVDNTIAVEFDANGAAGTTATLETNNTTSRSYSLIDPGADTDVVLTEGAQTIAGVKTITDTALNVSNAGDPSIVFAFDAAGTPGTTATINMSQGANNTYNFADPGADTDIFLTAGAQTAVGAKTFSDGGFTVFNAGTPTAQMQFQLDGNAGTSSTLNFNQTTATQFSLPNPAADTDILLTEGNQTVISPIGFAGGLSVDLVTEITPGFGTEIEGVRVFQEAGFVNYMQIIPNTAPLNANLVLTPKGSGAIITVAPDAGGTTQPRGAGAIDFQRLITTGNPGAEGSVIVTGQQGDIDPTANYSGILLGNVSSIGSNSINCVTCTSSSSVSINCSNCAAIGGSVNVGSICSVVLGGTNNTIFTSTNCAVLAGTNNDILSSTNCGIAGGDTNVIDQTDDSVIVGSTSCNMTGPGIASSFMAGCREVEIQSNMVNCAMIGCFQSVGSSNDNCNNSVGLAQGNLDINLCDNSVAIACQSASLDNSDQTVLVSASSPATNFNIMTDCFIIGSSLLTVNNNTTSVGVNANIDFGIRSISIANSTVSASQNSVGMGLSFVTSDNSIAIGPAVPDVDDTVMLCYEIIQASAFTADTGCVYITPVPIGASTIVLSSSDNGAGATSLQAKNFVNDAAAAVGGITIGEVYRNGSNLQIRVA